MPLNRRRSLKAMAVPRPSARAGIVLAGKTVFRFSPFSHLARADIALTDGVAWVITHG